MKNSNSSPKKNQKFLGLRLKSFISTFPKPRKGFRVSAFQIIINLKNGKFGDIEIKKQKFHQHKESISIKNTDINRITVSNKVCFGEKGFKCFIGYKKAEKKWIK